MWPTEAVLIRSLATDLEPVAKEVYARVCRTGHNAPGFCVINLGADLDSVAFRGAMVGLKQALAGLHEERAGQTLVYLSAGRFDQQTSTKPHLDGGPEESLLMLGYEPSEVGSELEIADYTKCARDLGMAPAEFMDRHNPMFDAGNEKIRGYATQVDCFSKGDYQIVCINNSWAPFDPSGPAWQGTLHRATVPTPDFTQKRVINTTLMAPAPVGTPDAIAAERLDGFVNTNAVGGRGRDS